MSEGDEPAKSKHRHPVLAGTLKAAAVVLVLMVAVFYLRGKLPSITTVLVYRLLSCWLIIPVGLLCWLGLRRPSHRHAVEDEPELLGQVGGRALVPGQVPKQRVLEHAVHQGVGQLGRHREP